MVDPFKGTGVRELYKQLTELLGPQIGQGITPYAGQMVPGVSPIQETGFGLAGGMGPMAQGSQQYFQDVLGLAQPELAGRGMGMAEGTLQDVLKPWDPKAATEMWETSWKQPALETWREDVMPSIMEKGVRSAGTADSGPMQRELARSGETLTTNLGAQLANLLYSGEQAHKGRQQAGVGQAMNLAALPSNVLQGAGQVGGMGTDMLSQMLNIGGMQRGISGEQLQEPYAKWQQAQPWANPYLQNFLGPALSQPPMDVIAQEQGPGMFSQLLGPLGSFLGTEQGAGAAAGGIGSLLGGLGGLFGGGGGAAAAGLGGLAGPIAGGASALLPFLVMCDVRVKENFARIDNALEKVKQLVGHTYNFINEDDRTAGVIAQEVETVLPEAVIEKDGVKYVKYEAVIALLVNAVNEMNQKVEELRSNQNASNSHIL